jgi:hypothetical protein
MAGMNITHVRLAGVELDGPEEAPWGRYVTLADPDGNKLVLAGPPTR